MGRKHKETKGEGEEKAKYVKYNSSSSKESL